MIVDLLLDGGFFEWGLFDILCFSDLSSPLIYPPGPLQCSESQVLVDVGREHANVIFLHTNSVFRIYRCKRSKMSPNQSDDSW
jgi:hypothetical protein